MEVSHSSPTLPSSEECRCWPWPLALVLLRREGCGHAKLSGHGHPLPFLPLALTSLVKEECDHGHPFLLNKEKAREGSGHGHYSSYSSSQKGQGKRRVWPWPLSLLCIAADPKRFSESHFLLARFAFGRGAGFAIIFCLAQAAQVAAGRRPQPREVLYMYLYYILYICARTHCLIVHAQGPLGCRRILIGRPARRKGQAPRIGPGDRLNIPTGTGARGLKHRRDSKTDRAKIPCGAGGQIPHGDPAGKMLGAPWGSESAGGRGLLTRWLENAPRARVDLIYGAYPLGA